MLTQARLKEVLRYEPDTGKFFWIRCNRQPFLNGQEAGSASGHSKESGGIGYIQIRLDGKLHFAHRLAFLYVTGSWPVNHVDHINGDKADNRWANLRDVTRSVNLGNQHRAKAGNRVGLLGVSMNRSKYEARIYVNGSCRRLGRFDTPEAAHEAYMAARRSQTVIKD